MKKRGYFFSLDAFIALVIILGVVLFVKHSPQQISQDVNVQKDFLEVLSFLKIGELNNSYADYLRSSGAIINYNQSVLDQIGEFYSNLDKENASLLTNSILKKLNLTENIGLYFDDTLLGNSNSSSLESSSDVWTSRQLISGVGNVEGSSKGFSSRAFLTYQRDI